MIVVAILAILILIGIMAFLNNLHKANDAKRKADLVEISTAIEGYYSDHECYPDLSIISTCGSDSLEPYLKTIPCDPVGRYPYCYFASNEVPVSGCYQEYHLLATLKNLADPDIEKLGCDGESYCGWESECGATSDRFGFNYGLSSQNISIANPSLPADGGPLPPTLPPTSESGVYACTPTGSCDNYGTHENAINKGCLYTFDDAHVMECSSYCPVSPLEDRCNE